MTNKPTDQSTVLAGVADAGRLLADALERMDRARSILTDDNPRPACNWGMLDTADIRAALASSTSIQRAPVEGDNTGPLNAAVRLLADLSGEIDAGWSPYAQMLVRKLGPLLQMAKMDAVPQSAPVESERPVTSILLEMVSGPDGMGLEVYAKSVEDVENVLSKMGLELEEWQLGIKRLPDAPQPTPTMEQSIQHLIAALIKDKGWVRDYGDSAIRDAIDRVAPARWKLVPIEPTKEMLVAAVVFANGNAVYKNVAAKALEIEEQIYAEVYSAMLAAAPQSAPSLPASDAGEQLQRIVAGALFDLMGYLTSRKEALTLSSHNHASPAVDALQAWAKTCGLPLDEADVRGWRVRAALKDRP